MSTTSDGGATAAVRPLLWLSLPIAAGGLVASAAGLLAPSVYAAETVDWAAQGRGQDAINLVVFPAMLWLAWRSGRGSTPAFLAWLGVVAYSAYSYLLYSGWVHFGPLFLVHVATFGLSVFALVWGLAAIDAVRLSAAFGPSTPRRVVGGLLVGIGGLFAVLWLSEIVPPLLDGTQPPTLVSAGLVSNPVWVLDLGLVLPAMVLAGVTLRRGRPLGDLLAVPLLVFGIVMGVAIVGIVTALALAGEPFAVAPVAMVGLVVAAEAFAVARMLRHLSPGADLPTIVRRRARIPPRRRPARSEPTAEPAHDLR